MAVTDAVMPLAERLLDCLCALLEGSVGGPVCHCCVYPGRQVPVDYCCDCPTGGEGQAWVRVERIYPTSGRFPARATRPEPCGGGGAWAVELVMGVYRCVATLDDAGNPPPCDRIFADAEKLLSDAAVMRAAASCCFPTGETESVPGDYEPLDSDGGCGGGVMSLLVRFDECCPDLAQEPGFITDSPDAAAL